MVSLSTRHAKKTPGVACEFSITAPFAHVLSELTVSQDVVSGLQDQIILLQKMPFCHLRLGAVPHCVSLLVTHNAHECFKGSRVTLKRNLYEIHI